MAAQSDTFIPSQHKRSMLFLTALLTLVRKEVMRLFRIWGQTFVPPVITMTLYFLIFGQLIGRQIAPIGGHTYIAYITPGLIMMAVIQNAYINVSSSFFTARFLGAVEEMLIAPMPHSLILAGYTLGGVCRAMIVGGLVLIIATSFTPLNIHHLGLMVLTATLTAIFCSLAGFVNGCYAKKFDDVGIIPTFVITPLTYLGGVFFSAAMLPPVWQTLIWLNPIHYIIDAFRYTMLGHAGAPLWQALCVLCGGSMLLAAFALWALKQGRGRRI